MLVQYTQRLPPEIWLHVFLYIDLGILHALFLTSRSLYRIAMDCTIDVLFGFYNSAARRSDACKRLRSFKKSRFGQRGRANLQIVIKGSPALDHIGAADEYALFLRSILRTLCKLGRVRSVRIIARWQREAVSQKLLVAVGPLIGQVQHLELVYVPLNTTHHGLLQTLRSLISVHIHLCAVHGNGHPVDVAIRQFVGLFPTATVTISEGLLREFTYSRPEHSLCIRAPSTYDVDCHLEAAISLVEFVPRHIDVLVDRFATQAPAIFSRFSPRDRLLLYSTSEGFVECVILENGPVNLPMTVPDMKRPPTSPPIVRRLTRRWSTDGSPLLALLLEPVGAFLAHMVVHLGVWPNNNIAYACPTLRSILLLVSNDDKQNNLDFAATTRAPMLRRVGFVGVPEIQNQVALDDKTINAFLEDHVLCATYKPLLPVYILNGVRVPSLGDRFRIVQKPDLSFGNRDGWLNIIE